MNPQVTFGSSGSTWGRVGGAWLRPAPSSSARCPWRQRAGGCSRSRGCFLSLLGLRVFWAASGFGVIPWRRNSASSHHDASWEVHPPSGPQSDALQTTVPVNARFAALIKWLELLLFTRRRLVRHTMSKLQERRLDTMLKSQ